MASLFDIHGIKKITHGFIIGRGSIIQVGDETRFG
jgi:hypothetical protein